MAALKKRHNAYVSSMRFAATWPETREAMEILELDPSRDLAMVSSSLKFDSFWANLIRYQHVGPVERATSDYFSRGGVRTPRNPSVFTTALRFSTNC
jgi:hypothetical protein